MSRSGNVQGVFWMADGVLFRDDILLPVPPPLRWCVAVAAEIATWRADLSAGWHIETAEFELMDEWRPTLQRVHYRLASFPSHGREWWAHNGRIFTQSALNKPRALLPPPSPRQSGKISMCI